MQNIKRTTWGCWTRTPFRLIKSSLDSQSYTFYRLIFQKNVATQWELNRWHLNHLLILSRTLAQELKLHTKVILTNPIVSTLLQEFKHRTTLDVISLYSWKNEAQTGTSMWRSGLRIFLSSSIVQQNESLKYWESLTSHSHQLTEKSVNNLLCVMLLLNSPI